MKYTFTLFASLTCTTVFAQIDSTMAPFYHGVASGDALSDKVILWTRVTADSGVYSVSVDWEIATDNQFTTIVNSGTTTADSSADYTVKIDATGLQADTWHYYRFSSNGNQSIVGRTRTMPSGAKDKLKLAVSSCSNGNDGQYFHVYGEIAQRTDIDAVLHLGDFYYEGGGSISGGGIAILPTHETVSLEDYRLRF
ncbi:MAG: PhoD-like phosphatase N-terminal domain-containing protein, partial [Flavobacteriales bacterium]|nr:PhoD-like phosphatase N-terminal domain-containing protein [Flavobacteriales bacterium]